MDHAIDDEAFDKVITTSKKPVLIWFRADWCGPSKSIAPSMKEISEEFDATLTVRSMDIDANPDTPQKFGVRGIPTMIIFHEGIPIATKVGSMPKKMIVDWLREAAPPHEFDDQLAAESNLIGVTEVGGKLRVVELNADGRYQFVTGRPGIHNGFVPRLIESASFFKAISEFEQLINDDSAKEQDYQDFFQAHPHFILGEDHAKAHSKIVIETETQEKLIPDFVLEPFDKNGLCDLLELKRPDASIYSLKRNRAQFSYAVREAVTQLRYYSDCFREQSVRERIHDKYGLNIFRPRMIVVIGRRGDIEPKQFRLFEAEFPDTRIRTYDDILDLARRRFGLAN